MRYSLETLPFTSTLLIDLLEI